MTTGINEKRKQRIVFISRPWRSKNVLSVRFRTVGLQTPKIADLIVIKLNPYFLFIHYSGETLWVNNFPNRCIAI